MGMKLPQRTLDEWIAKGLIAPPPPPPVPDLEPELSEEEFQSRVIALAKEKGWRVYHTRDSRRSEKGFPDLILLRGEVEIVAELKVPPNKPTSEQREWLAAFQKAGRPTFVFYPTDWNEIKGLLI
jgi:hypothetical protein